VGYTDAHWCIKDTWIGSSMRHDQWSIELIGARYPLNFAVPHQNKKIIWTIICYEEMGICKSLKIKKALLMLSTMFYWTEEGQRGFLS